MNETTCSCGQPTRDDAYVCDNHRDELEKALAEVPATIDEIELTMTRQRSAPISGGPSSATKPLPWHEKAADAKRNLRAILVSWVRLCDEEGVRGAPTRLPDDDPAAMSRYLLHCAQGLALHEAGMDAVDEITDAVAECWRVISWRKRERIYLGRCGQVVKDDDGEVITLACDGDVYAEEGEPVGHCEDCAQGVTVVIRKAEIDKLLNDRLMTAAEASTAAIYLGLPVSRERVRNRINQWHKRGRITAAPADTDEIRFRYADLRRLLFAEFGRDAG